MSVKLISFTEENILPLLEAATKEERDQLDFGVVGMDAQGIIHSYNKYEAELASVPESEAVGKVFFTQIAPCTNNFMIAAKYLENPEKRDEYLDYVFTYRIKPTPVKLRLLVNPESKNQYLLVKTT